MTVMSAAEAVFFAALAKVDPAERAAYLSEACGSDAELRRQVDRLLAAHPQVGSFLQDVGAAHPSSRGGVGQARGGATVDALVTESPGTVIGPYKLLQQIGEGGMGVVWMAEQTQPVQRKVALKVIKPGMDSRQVIARFEAERQALAIMDHVNIARVFDGGTTESGRPYFVMELVHGVPITKYCDDNHLTPRERLELFVPVCQAIQHAHQKGIIHRDIKPSNVMITLYDGKPVPKVIDFGVAKATEQKLTERTLFTQYGTMVGTLEYMSPEQAEMSALGVDTRSDVYSLGVLLYELLTGSTPLTHKRLKQAAYGEILRLIKEEEPQKPSTRLSDSGEALASISAQRHMEPAKLTKLVRGELDWIVMKCLEKDRNRRYETASAFAWDVHRYLNDEPVLACPPSAWYRLKKFARRQQLALMVAGLVLFFLVLLGGGVGWIVGDRSARGAQTAADMDVALRQVQVLQEQQRWREALEVAKHTQMLLANAGGNDDLQRLVRQRVADLELVMKLQDAHLLGTEVRDDHFASAELAAASAQAFREYGMDVEAENPEEAGALLRDRGIGVEVAAALDYWFLSTPNVSPQVLAIARAADPDPKRDELRAAVAGNDSRALEKLTAPDPAAKLPAPTLVLMGRAAKYSLDARVARFVEGPQWAERVVALLRNAQRQHPDDFWINHDLAFALHHLRPAQPDEAVRFYTGALSLRPRSPGVYPNLAIVLQARGQLDEAITALRQAIRLKPDYAHAHNNLAADLMAKGELDEAIAEYREAIRIKKDYAKPHNGLALALVGLGRLDDAFAAWQEAIRIDKNFAAAHVSLGVTLRIKGQLKEAIAELRKAIQIDKNLAAAHVELAKALDAAGQLDAALAEYRQGLRIAPQDSRAHNQLAWFLANCRDAKFRDPPSAVKSATRAVALLPNASHWNTLGVAQYRAGNWKACAEALQKSMALSKGGDANDWFFLAMARWQLGDKTDSRKWYDRAVPWMEKNQPGNAELGASGRKRKSCWS